MRRISSRAIRRNPSTKQAASGKKPPTRKREAQARKNPIKLAQGLYQRIKTWNLKAAIPATTFLLSSVVMTWTAWSLYPASQSMPPRANPIEASVVAKQKIRALSFTISDPIVPSRHAVMSFYGEAEGAVPAGQTAEVYIAVPDILLVPGELTFKCIPDCIYANEFGQGTTFTRSRFEFRASWQKADDGSWGITAGLDLPLTEIARVPARSANVLDIPSMACSKSDCRGSVPLVSVDEKTPLTPDATALVDLSYPVLKGYDWQSSITPYPNADLGLRFNYQIPRSRSVGYLPEFAVDGVDHDAEKETEFHFFLSGVLAAFASALLLAAAQDILGVYRAKKSVA